MPLKVRCRCGQELVLRYSEWVYFVVGFLVLSLLVNVVVLVLIYNQLRTADERAVSAPVASEPARADGRQEAQGNRLATLPPLAEKKNTESGPEPVVAALRSSGDRDGQKSPARPFAEIKRPLPPSPLRSVSEKSDVLPSGDGVEAALADVARVESRHRLKKVVPQGTGTPDAVSAAIVSGTRFRAIEKEFPSILRYAMTEALGDVATPDAIRIWCALLLDPDERVRARARFLLADRLLGGVAPGETTASFRAAGNDLILQDPALRDFVARWVHHGAPWIGTTELGRSLVRRFGGDAGDNKGANAGQTGGDDIEGLPWETVRQLALKFVTSTDELRFLRDALDHRSANGTDVLLVVDVTESMADSLAAIRKVAQWVLPLVVWSARQCRVAGLFYRDEVVGTVDFDSDTTTLVAAIGQEQATGGGADVPEGVLEALRGALQLGRFSWRPKAEKIVIVVGDAPPPYENKQALLTLAEQAHREEGYQINALSVRHWDGWDGVPFFAELARQGGGRALKSTEADRPGVDDAQWSESIGSAIFALSLPNVPPSTKGSRVTPEKLVEALLAYLRHGVGG